MPRPPIKKRPRVTWEGRVSPEDVDAHLTGKDSRNTWKGNVADFFFKRALGVTDGPSTDQKAKPVQGRPRPH